MSKELNFDPSISRSDSVFDGMKWERSFNHCHFKEGTARIWRGDFPSPWFWSIEFYNQEAFYVQGKAESPDRAMDLLDKWHKILKADMEK